MSFKCQYTEFKKWLESTEKLARQFNDFLSDFVGETAERILAQAVKKTPVDTGNLRASWEITNMHKVGNNIVFDIKNDMEYATEIEFGHRLVDRNGNELRWVEGYFMLTLSIEYVSKRVKSNFKDAFYDFLARIDVDFK